jgi:hypothetical protein
MVESHYALFRVNAIVFLHVSILRTTTTFGCNPSDILRRLFDIACLTVDAILRVYNEFFFLNFVNTYWAIS